MEFIHCKLLIHHYLLKNFVPANYLQTDSPTFDLANSENDIVKQLRSEVVKAFSKALSNYTNNTAKGDIITNISLDVIGFKSTMINAIEDNYHWETARCLKIVNIEDISIDYDETKDHNIDNHTLYKITVEGNADSDTASSVYKKYN